MKAFILRHQGDHIEGLFPADLPVPAARPNEVLVKSVAVDINPVDNKTVRGYGQFARLKKEDPIVLGWGVAGLVEQVGADVYGFRKGDPVFGLVNLPGHGRAYAEYVAVPADQVVRKPAKISFEEAAASTLTALTAYQGIQLAQVHAGERVYVQGAAGGIGFFLVQMAKHYGVWVAGSASARDEALLKTAGLDLFIDYRTTDFRQAVSDVDVAFDMQGNESVVNTLGIVKRGGRLITFPTTPEQNWKKDAAERGVDAQHMMVHSSGEDMQVIAGWLDKGIVKPHIVSRFRFGEMLHVHELMSAGKLSGKTVVSLPVPGLP